ncbi:hypothetical protein KQI52_13520 [bacterium]|nr:hypothetical protein [bacterium]
MSPDSSATPGLFQGMVVADSNGVVQLPDRFIDPATLSITTPDGIPVNDYEFDPGSAMLKLAVSGADTLIVSYRYLPLTPPAPVQLQKPLPIAVVDSLLAGQEVVSLPQRDPFAQPERGFASSLRRSGHITRGVQVGSGRDVSLESGLRLALEGRLAQDIEVNALLDDRNLPIAPEGTSRRLDEIDQVYVEIQAGRTDGRFGDYHLETGTGRYGEIDRRLEGGRASYDGPDISVTAAGAVTRAVFHTYTFNGVDGIQGPYRLVGRDGEQDFLVVGGSETVWVDGVQMQRGAAADYTIDYSRGEITFTPSRPITSESRIEVDFEYSPEAYPRNLYAGEVTWRDPAERFRASFMLAQEGDDGERPYGFDMSSGIRDQLADAGDQTGRILVPTAEEVEWGEADYIRRDTTWTDTETYDIFVFVEPDDNGDPQGNWRVPFSDVGSGSGDYEREYDAVLGLYKYIWVGPGNGAYTAKRSLPLPERRRNAAFSLIAGEHENITLHADLGLSDVDANTFSSRNDNDNTGFAQNVRLSATPFGKGKDRLPAAPLEITARVRNEPAEYQPFGRTQDVEYNRRWGLDSTDTGDDQLETELRLDARPMRELSVSSGAAYLEQGDKRLRGDASASWASRAADANAFVERILDNPWSESRTESTNQAASSGEITRARGNAVYRVAGLVAPGIDGEWEENRDDAFLGDSLIYIGHRYWRVRPTLGLLEYDGHSGSIFVQQRRRDTQSTADRFNEVYRSSGYGAIWNWRPATSSWRSQLEFSHNEKSFSIADSADVTTDLAALSAGYAPLAGAITSDLNYQLSRTVSRPNALIAYSVPAGQGDYIRVDDEYVYDPEVGDIILRPEPTGDAIPTTDLAAALNFDWSPHRLPGGAGRQDGFGWEDISLVTQLEAQEITSWPDPADIYLLNLSAFQSDSTVEGRLTLRQDVYLFRSSRNGNLRFRYLAEKRLANLYLTGAERYARDKLSALGRLPLSRTLDLETEASYERLTKQLARRNSTDRFRLLRFSNQFGWRPNSTWRLTLRLGGLLDHDIAAGEDVSGLSLTPGLVYAVRERGRISGDFEALWVQSNLTTIPYELANGRPVGRNGRGNLRAEYQLGDHLTGRATYSVRLDEGREPIHVGRMEISAFF